MSNTINKDYFFPFSEVVYIKFYCGPVLCDRILKDAIAPLIEEFKESNAIPKWFYIRYGDPDWHIRLRLFVNSAFDANQLFFFLSRITNTLVDNGVYKVQLDTYQREIARYGLEHIEKVESIFFSDSEFVLALLCESQIDGRFGEMRWMYAFFSLSSVIGILEFSHKEASHLFEGMANLLFNEFGGSAELKSNLSKNCREFRLDASACVDKIELSSNCIILLKRRNEQLLELYETCKHEERSKKFFTGNLLPSIIHMHCNRLFTYDQRKYELMLYELLARYYKSKTFLIR